MLHIPCVCVYILYTVDQICGYWLQTCHNSLKCHLGACMLKIMVWGPPAGVLRPPSVTVMEELVAMTTSGDNTSEGAKGEEGEVHMYMYIELR